MRSVGVNDTIMFFQFMPFVDLLIPHSLRFWFFFIRSFVLHLFIPSVHFFPVNFTYMVKYLSLTHDS